MKPLTIKPSKGLRGEVVLPGDKSISHRAAICAALARGRTVIKNFLICDDCLVTLTALKALGVKIDLKKSTCEVVIQSKAELRKPKSVFHMGESGTSARILTGLLAAQDFSSRVSGAPSLLKRPMARVLEPLRRMGAHIDAKKKGSDESLPLNIHPSPLKGVDWTQKIASAQVKSAILMAGLSAEGETIVRERLMTRDHTERMLRLFRADISFEKNAVKVKPGHLQTPGRIFIPGDISSAVFFIVAALLIRNSRIIIKNVSINPTRTGALNVLRRMGADIWVIKVRDAFEPMADLEVATSRLRGTVIKAHEIPSLIDELPILMVAATLAYGTTLIEAVQELRVKETDRIKSMVTNLLKLGANIKVKSLNKNTTIEIKGVDSLKGGKLKSFGDHRTAMSMFVASLASKNPSRIDDVSCISKSFPKFFSVFGHLIAQ